MVSVRGFPVQRAPDERAPRTHRTPTQSKIMHAMHCYPRPEEALRLRSVLEVSDSGSARDPPNRVLIFLSMFA